MRVEALLLACCALTSVVSIPNRGTVTPEEGTDEDSSILSGLDIEALKQAFGDVPHYVEALESLERNGKALKNLLPHEALRVTDPRRHYVLIAGVLGCMVEYLNSDCTPPDYEHEFIPAVDILLPVVWQDPKAAVAKLERFIDDTNDTVHHVKELVDLHCAQLSAATCNLVLQAIASQTNEFDDALELLILVGELAEIYEKNRYADEAAHYNSVALLLTGQTKLKPLVYKGAEVYNKLYGSHCEP